MLRRTVRATEISLIPSIIRTEDRGATQAEAVPRVEEATAQVVEVMEAVVLEVIEMPMGTEDQTGAQVTPEALVMEEVQAVGAAQEAAQTYLRDLLGDQATTSRPRC